MKKKLLQLVTLVIAIAALGIVIAVHQTATPQAGNKITVSASFYPLYEFAKQVGGDRVSVTNITPAGAEPHDFEPTPQTLLTTQNADLFIYNGGTMEPWVSKFLPDYKHVAVKASEHIALHQTTEGNDPHFWLDPVLAQQIVNNIRDGLGKVQPASKDYFAKNAAAYNKQLAALDTQIKNGLRTCQTRTIVTSHDAFSYYAERYGLNAVAIAGMDPSEEPSAAKLAELSDLVKQQNVQYVFFESLVSPKLADTIAQETGTKTAVFDPLEGLTDDAQKAGKNYSSVQQDNLAALRTALGCR
ncbi:MAG TPA: zinc ABC transporter substrate-binding protein [Candidatus Saccharimonas sp.]|nr:zinc ABC transporter substrate-binding protein [Candidatus Saccharimonas sp.]